MCGEDICGRTAIQRDGHRGPTGWMRWDQIRKEGWLAGGRRLFKNGRVLNCWATTLWLPSLWEPASSAVITSWKVYFPQRQMGSIRKLTALEAGPMLVPRPAHGGFVVQLNSYLS